MDWLALLLGKKKEVAHKTAADYQREELIDSGEQQFKKLIDLGVRIPEVPLKVE
jgi:hypothetical protein